MYMKYFCALKLCGFFGITTWGNTDHFPTLKFSPGQPPFGVRVRPNRVGENTTSMFDFQYFFFPVDRLTVGNDQRNPNSIRICFPVGRPSESDVRP